MLRYYYSANTAFTRFRPFHDREAWTLFRVAAFAEAVGWTVLIIGIACKQLPVSWHDVPVAVAGRIHGMMFILYIMAALAFGSSLGWSIIKTLVAGLFSMPPYGSIIFEQYESHRRTISHTRTAYRTVWYYRLTAQV